MIKIPYGENLWFFLMVFGWISRVYLHTPQDFCLFPPPLRGVRQYVAVPTSPSLVRQ